MLTELHRKGGCLCQPAQQGTLRCPLIVRPTSEDVITDQLVQAWRGLNPRWWLPDLLNQALGVSAYSRQYFRQLRIEPWVNKPRYPRELLYWDEGSTQVDIVLTWENPPTTVYVEMKYGSELSAATAQNQGQHGYPADQLARNVRVGLWECGYFELPRLFSNEQRDFLLLVITPGGQQRLVAKYRSANRIRAAIPHSHLIHRLPRLPFLGDLGYRDVMDVLQRNRRWYSRSERIVLEHLHAYLELKLATLPNPLSIPSTMPLLPAFDEDETGSQNVNPAHSRRLSDAEATTSQASTDS